MNLCNKYFSTVGYNLAETILDNSKTTENILASQTTSNQSPVNSLFFTPTDITEIDTIIKQLKTDSAPGLDGITNSLLKEIRTHVVAPLTHVFNISLSTGVFPSSWKIAAITPIYKSGNSDDPKNYRPISLLPTISKILEKIVNKRLVNYLESNNLLSDRQFGFRRNKCTKDAIELLTNSISSHLDSGLSCVAVFLDLAKAFDTVSIPILLRKLENLGIRGVTLDWFKSYLSDRHQVVQIQGILSNELPVNFGVPQGSVLGPTLFLIYMNDIHQLCIPSAELLCYADDTVVLFYADNWESVASCAERGMIQIKNWLERNLLTLNADKTNYICFYKTAASQPKNPFLIYLHSHTPYNLPCNCIILNRTESVKYLGVILDERLTFRPHINLTTARVRKLIGIMRLLRNSASWKTLRTVYFALCQSIISYCIEVWGAAARTSMIVLERAQRALLKVILMKPYRYSTNDLYIEARVLRVRQLFILRSCLSVLKIIRNSPLYDDIKSKRSHKIPLPYTKTSFAKRFPSYSHPSVFNNVTFKCSLWDCTLFTAKTKVTNFLLDLDYTETENLTSRIVP